MDFTPFCYKARDRRATILDIRQYSSKERRKVFEMPFKELFIAF